MPERRGRSTNDGTNSRLRNDLRHFKLRHKKGRGFVRGPSAYDLLVNSSVAVGANSDAHAGSAEAHSATFVITPALDITLTRSVSI